MQSVDTFDNYFEILMGLLPLQLFTYFDQNCTKMQIYHIFYLRYIIQQSCLSLKLYAVDSRYLEV